MNCNKSGKYREILIQCTGVSTFVNPYKRIRRPKFAKELSPLPPKKNYFIKSPLLKFLKPATAQAKQK
ncbi:MAG: hypothetical protein A2046_10620 [Bacteroidetes bacterium GWA2_30_7]|nr:MAG: hypothetical protein A2046_10620 [Bacteroidetes bacterium GWA2_30_7]